MNSELLVVTIPAALGCVGTLGAAWIANRARKEVRNVAAKVEPVSDGFAATVLQSLMDIRGEVSATRAELHAHIRDHHGRVAHLSRRRVG